MKKKKIKHPNSHAREVAMQGLYQIEVGGASLEDVLKFSWLNAPFEEEKKQYCSYLLERVAENTDSIDSVIGSISSIQLSQVSIVTKNLLRLAIIELLEREIKPEIIIDDFLELTRKYDGEESVAFVNGVLDRFKRELSKNSKEITDY